MSEILATVNGTDISKYIIKDSYEVNTEPTFESWQDGNYREHRIYSRDRVKGKFDVIFFGTDNTPYQNFLSLLDSATSGRRLTIGMYVQNTAQFGLYEVYYKITAAQHAETTDGRMVNKMTIDFEEY